MARKPKVAMRWREPQLNEVHALLAPLNVGEKNRCFESVAGKIATGWTTNDNIQPTQGIIPANKRGYQTSYVTITFDTYDAAIHIASAVEAWTIWKREKRRTASRLPTERRTVLPSNFPSEHAAEISPETRDDSCWFMFSLGPLSLFRVAFSHQVPE
jgi:hypothetical protein